MTAGRTARGRDATGRAGTEARRASRRPRGDLARLERKVDRLTALVAAAVVIQLVVLTAVVTPEQFFGAVAAVLFAAILGLAALAAFPGLRRRVPGAMRWLGRVFGRLRRWLRPVR